MSSQGSSNVRYHHEMMSRGEVVVIAPREPSEMDIEHTKELFSDVIRQMMMDKRRGTST